MSYSHIQIKETRVWNHFLPEYDILEHEESLTCRCNPQIYIEESSVVHFALDGRPETVIPLIVKSR